MVINSAVRLLGLLTLLIRQMLLVKGNTYIYLYMKIHVMVKFTSAGMRSFKRLLIEASVYSMYGYNKLTAWI